MFEHGRQKLTDKLENKTTEIKDPTHKGNHITMKKMIDGLEKDINVDIGSTDAKLTQYKKNLMSRKLSPNNRNKSRCQKMLVVKFHGKIMVEARNKKFRKILIILVLEKEDFKASLDMDWLLEFYSSVQYSKNATNGTSQSEEGKTISQISKFFHTNGAAKDKEFRIHVKQEYIPMHHKPDQHPILGKKTSKMKKLINLGFLKNFKSLVKTVFYFR